MKNKSGIYKIMNNINKRVYIGSAKNLFTRKNKHFALLARNKHYNSFLQNDFNKHGFDKYTFSILEYCSVELLIETEQKWIDRYFDNQNMCYNILKEAGNSLGYKHRKQSLELQSKSQSGRKISKITKTKISKSNKIY